MAQLQTYIIGASLSKPHANRHYEKNHVHMYVCMYVAIRRPRGHHATAQARTAKVRIVTVLHMLNKAH